MSSSLLVPGHEQQGPYGHNLLLSDITLGWFPGTYGTGKAHLQHRAEKGLMSPTWCVLGNGVTQGWSSPGSVAAGSG